MRVLAALVLVLTVAFISLAALGAFAPTQPAPRSPTGTPTAARTPTPSPTGPRPVVITFTEDELTKAAAAYTPLTVSGITVTDPRIRLEPGRLTLIATGRAFIVGGPVVVVATPAVSDGRAAAKVESATFVGLALSDSSKQEIADTFTRVLTANIPAGARISSISVSAGKLVVEAVT